MLFNQLKPMAFLPIADYGLAALITRLAFVAE